MTAPRLSLVAVLGDPRTSQPTLAAQLGELSDVHVTLVTRVQPSSELRAACSQVVVLPHAVPVATPKPPPPTPEEQAELDAAAAEAANAPLPTGVARVQAAVAWRGRRVVLGAKRRVRPASTRARQLQHATTIDRAIRGDRELEHRIASAGVVCAVDTTATPAVWQIGRRHPEPAVVQGFAAVAYALSRAAREQ